MKDTTNFFRDQRVKLNLNLTQMAARCGATAQTVLNWESDVSVPSPTVETLAKAYEVSESRMERELMAQRRRIERRREANMAAAG